MIIQPKTIFELTKNKMLELVVEDPGLKTIGNFMVHGSVELYLDKPDTALPLGYEIETGQYGDNVNAFTAWAFVHELEFSTPFEAALVDSVADLCKQVSNYNPNLGRTKVLTKDDVIQTDRIAYIRGVSSSTYVRQEPNGFLKAPKQTQVTEVTLFGDLYQCKLDR